MTVATDTRLLSSEELFADHLTKILPATNWSVSLPTDDYDEGVTVRRSNTSADEAVDNSIYVRFNYDSIPELGITDHLVDYKKSAIEAYRHLMELSIKTQMNPQCDLLPILMAGVKASRPEWKVTFKKEYEAIDDWFTMELEVDGVPYKGSFHAYHFSGAALGLTSESRWANLTERPEGQYREAVSRLIRNVEKEAKKNAKAKNPKKGFWAKALSL